MDSYPGAITQVVQNLINNCLIHGFGQARGGTIRIRAQEMHGGMIALSVGDNGIGIPGANLERVFDPFFTTKMGSGGSGLGLHVVHNFVTAILGGRIELNSQLGKGTTFTLLLPATVPPHPAANANQLAVAES